MKKKYQHKFRTKKMEKTTPNENLEKSLNLWRKYYKAMRHERIIGRRRGYYRNIGVYSRPAKLYIRYLESVYGGER